MSKLTLATTVLVPLIILGIIRYYLYKLEKNKVEKVTDRFGKSYIRMISSNTNYFGQASKGAMQVRGNGVLAITGEELYFEKWSSEDCLLVPVGNIITIEEVKTFLGKTKFRPLVKISYITEEGNLDSSAWLIKDSKSWIEKMNKICKNTIDGKININEDK